MIIVDSVHIFQYLAWTPLFNILAQFALVMQCYKRLNMLNKKIGPVQHILGPRQGIISSFPYFNGVLIKFSWQKSKTDPLTLRLFHFSSLIFSFINSVI